MFFSRAEKPFVATGGISVLYFFALHIDPFQGAFQSSNPIGQFIIYDYMRICAVALTMP